MKLIKLFLVSLVSTLTVAEAVAGDKAGNGGVGVECRSVRGDTSLVTLDFYEATARSPYGRGLKISVANNLNATVDYFCGSSKKLSSKMRAECRAAYAAALTAGAASSSNQESRVAAWGFVAFDYHFRPQPISLTNDYGKYEIAPNCRLKQIAVFHADEIIKTSGTVEVDSELYSQLDWVNRAMLIAHEETYYFTRMDTSEYRSFESVIDPENRRNSEWARAAVARDFAGLRDVYKKGIPLQVTTAATSIIPNAFEATLSDSPKGLLLDFLFLGGGLSFTNPVYAVVPSLTQKTMHDGSKLFDVTGSVKLSGYGSSGLSIRIYRTHRNNDGHFDADLVRESTGQKVGPEIAVFISSRKTVD